MQKNELLEVVSFRFLPTLLSLYSILNRELNKKNKTERFIKEIIDMIRTKLMNLERDSPG